MLTVNILKVQRKIVEYITGQNIFIFVNCVNFSFRVSVREMTREITIIFAR